MKATLVAAAVLLAAATLPVAAAETCPGALSNNNPAFGAPRPCPKPADPAKAAKPSKGGEAAKVTTRDGKTVYSYGDTTVAVSGSLKVDMIAGKGQLRP